MLLGPAEARSRQARRRIHEDEVLFILSPQVPEEDAKTLIGTLPPLAVLQLPVGGAFPGFTGEDGLLVVDQLPLAAGTDPAFIAYASMLDNRSNDPTYLEPYLEGELPVDCAY